MKILALDSSGLVASVAIVEDDNLLGEYTMNYKKTHSQTLLPMLDEVAKMIELDMNSLDAIAVSKGPGSFTGLRIGSATAKGLGLALNKPIVSVPTIDAMAFNMWGAKDLVCPIMDARRQQTYTGLFEFKDGKMNTIIEQSVLMIVKNLPAMQETWVRSLGWEDPLEQGTATHASFLAWRIAWTEEPRQPQSMGLHRAGHD